MAAVAILNNPKSRYLSNGLTDRHEIWHGDAVRPFSPFRPLKIWNFENIEWQRPPSWKIKNWHISAMVWTISTKFGTLFLTVPIVKNLKF